MLRFNHNNTKQTSNQTKIIGKMDYAIAQIMNIVVKLSAYAFYQLLLVIAYIAFLNVGIGTQLERLIEIKEIILMFVYWTIFAVIVSIASM